VRDLPFGDGEFDCVSANSMLFDVDELERSLSEIARVLGPGGRLVAVTNYRDHLIELWRLTGAGDARLAREMRFGGEIAGAALARQFGRVESRDASGAVRIAERDAIVRYVRWSREWRAFADLVPNEISLPFVARRSTVVFVADNP